MRPLDGSHLVSAEAGILTFVEAVDVYPYALVLRRRQIAGIVTLSDLQKLAVRPALFSMITCLELMLASFIRARTPIDEVWLEELGPNRRQKVEENGLRCRRLIWLLSVLRPRSLLTNALLR